MYNMENNTECHFTFTGFNFSMMIVAQIKTIFQRRGFEKITNISGNDISPI